jgi:hypothetical protein
LFVVFWIIVLDKLIDGVFMSSLQLRPRFKRSVELNPLQITERIRDYINNPDTHIEASITGHHAVFTILSREQHYWSPQLNLEILEEGKGALVKGLYGPAANVWTLFIFLYTGIGIIAIIGLLYGLVQWSLNMSPMALWIFPAAVLVELILYLTARSGQKIAAKQIELLQQELDRILK